MKKLFLWMILASLMLPLQAKSLRDLWVSMPDTLLPTFNKNLRMEFVDLLDMGVKPEVKNLLGEECLMDTLTADYLHLSTSSLGNLQMKLLPVVDSDSILCVVKTFAGPELESEVKFFDQNWKKMDETQFLPSDFWQLKRYFKVKPDTMSEVRYSELARMIEPVMFHVSFSDSDESITVEVSLPLLSKVEKMQVNAILLQRKFKWNGKILNEI